MTAALDIFSHPQKIIMGRTATPNYLKILNGSAKHNPDRHREDHLMPEPEGDLGDAPDHMSEIEKETWKEIQATIHPGVAGESDRISFELLIKLIVAIRLSDTIIAAHYTQYVSLASRFGMTPSDRQKVRIPEKPKKSGFDDV